MRSWVPPDTYRPIPRNVIVYDGPSRLTGAPILVIATASNGNRKIGHMLQLWIVPAISPLRAIATGEDTAVCGDCALRGQPGHARPCYVYTPGVDNIWQARGKAERLTPTAFAARVAGVQLRIGAYGDPVAVPLEIWTPMLLAAGGWTAYSHAWKQPIAQPYRAFCMASVDSEGERGEALALGWRTFRVRATTDTPIVDEVVCPASEEGGHRAVCADCSLCRGLARPAKDVVIVAHGMRARWFPSAAAAAAEGVRA